MSISSESRQTTPKLGNGTWTDITFTFKVFETTDIVVTQTDDDGVDTVLIEGSGDDYTVSLNADQDNNPGGTVTLTAVSVSGYYYTVSSDIPYLQEEVIVNLGGFFPSVINNALDRLTALIQQVLNKANRSLRIPVSDGVEAAALPTAAVRANKALGFDSNGDPVAVAFADIGASVDTVVTGPINNDFLVYSSGSFINKTASQVATIIGAFLTGSYNFKVSSNDTTPGFLNGKLVAGTGLTLTENNNGANETLTVAADIASQAQAEAGVSTTKLMTPQRVKQAITALLPDEGSRVLGHDYETDGTYGSTTTTIPHDDTVPGSTEGMEIVTLTYTRISASSRLVVEFGTVGGSSAGGTVAAMALFKDSDANALATVPFAIPDNALTFAGAGLYEMASGATGDITFKLRAGLTSAGTYYAHGVAGGRRFGGSAVSYIKVTEIDA